MKRIAVVLFLLAACKEGQRTVTDTGVMDTREPVTVKYVGAPELSVRQQPNDTAAVIATYQNGEAVSVLADKGEWLEVRTGDQAGWARASELVDAAAAEEAEDDPQPKFRVMPLPVSAPSAHGEIYLEADVNSDGEVVNVRTITNTTGSMALETQNTAALKAARFYPIVQNGERVKFKYYHRVTYSFLGVPRGPRSSSGSHHSEDPEELRLIPRNPLLHPRRLPCVEAAQEGFGVGADHGDVAMLFFHEALAHGAVEELHERREEAVHVEEAERFLMQPELRPRPHFENLFERAEAAGECDEGIGEIGHHRFAFMHGVDDAQIGEAAMADLARPERVRDHADDLPARAEDGVRQRPHQADAAAAVDEADALAREEAAQVARGLDVQLLGARIRSAEHADAADHRYSPASSHFAIVSRISACTLSVTLR
jgi:hypothetical protein